MRARRYTIVIADRTSGVVRRVGISLRPALAAVAGILALPVLIGLGAAQVVIQMEDVEVEVPERSQLAEHVEQANGIGAARHGDTDGLARFKHAVERDGLTDAVEHEDSLLILPGAHR